MKSVNGFHQWVSSLTITWLGNFLDMRKSKFYIVNDRIERIQITLHSILTQLQSQQLSIVPAKLAASIVGHTISTQLVLGKKVLALK